MPLKPNLAALSLLSLQPCLCARCMEPCQHNACDDPVPHTELLGRAAPEAHTLQLPSSLCSCQNPGKAIRPDLHPCCCAPGSTQQGLTLPCQNHCCPTPLPQPAASSPALLPVLGLPNPVPAPAPAPPQQPPQQPAGPGHGC
ncbi:hypothetical protein V8C86DRAFT_2481769, partial [Haematococcus lacustris]